MRKSLIFSMIISLVSFVKVILSFIKISVLILKNNLIFRKSFENQGIPF